MQPDREYTLLYSKIDSISIKIRNRTAVNGSRFKTISLTAMRGGHKLYDLICHVNRNIDSFNEFRFDLFNNGDLIATTTTSQDLVWILPMVRCNYGQSYVWVYGS